MEARNPDICGYWFSIRLCERIAVRNGLGDNIVLELLQHVRTAVDETRQDVRQLKTRARILEQQYASMSNRFYRSEHRLERIENRIGLIEA